MKITINILGDNTIVTLSRWASVSRTLRQAASLLEKLPTSEEVNACIEELEDLVGPLDSLHKSAQQEMWQLSCNQTIKKIGDRQYNCRLERGHVGTCKGF